jgi:hypothetical protein
MLPTTSPTRRDVPRGARLIARGLGRGGAGDEIVEALPADPAGREQGCTPLEQERVVQELRAGLLVARHRRLQTEAIPVGIDREQRHAGRDAAPLVVHDLRDRSRDLCAEIRGSAGIERRHRWDVHPHVLGARHADLDVGWPARLLLFGGPAAGQRDPGQQAQPPAPHGAHDDSSMATRRALVSPGAPD